MTDPPDVYSARTIRILAWIFVLITVGAAFLADGWLVWLFAGLAVVAFCAAVTPRFKRHPGGQP